MTPSVEAGLDVLAPTGTSAALGELQLDILPVPAGRIPALIRTAKPLLQALVANNVLTGEGDELDIDILQVVELMGDHGDAFFEALSIAAKVDVEDVRAAGIDEVVRLTQVCLRVNRDFFTKSVAPLLAGMAQRLPGAGQMPSNS